MPFYRGRTHHWQSSRDARALAGPGPKVRGRTCGYARYAAVEWRGRSRASRDRYERWRVDMRDPEKAIMHVFGPVHGPDAIKVAACESGDRDGDLSPHVVWAGVGKHQYLGMFQMGESERRIYGHGTTPLEQARAAHRYFIASGSDWSPWQCRPWGLAW